jgi:hypothetical protein
LKDRRAIVELESTLENLRRCYAPADHKLSMADRRAANNGIIKMQAAAKRPRRRSTFQSAMNL